MEINCKHFGLVNCTMIYSKIVLIMFNRKTQTIVSQTQAKKVLDPIKAMAIVTITRRKLGLRQRSRVNNCSKLLNFIAIVLGTQSNTASIISKSLA